MENNVSPRLMNIDEFVSMLEDEDYMFCLNMRESNKQLTFPEWYELFGSWLEVGTSEENDYHGPRSNSNG